LCLSAVVSAASGVQREEGGEGGRKQVKRRESREKPKVLLLIARSTTRAERAFYNSSSTRHCLFPLLILSEFVSKKSPLHSRRASNGHLTEPAGRAHFPRSGIPALRNKSQIGFDLLLYFADLLPVLLRITSSVGA
jgi:hypothetical protein